MEDEKLIGLFQAMENRLKEEMRTLVREEVRVVVREEVRVQLKAEVDRQDAFLKNALRVMEQNFAVQGQNVRDDLEAFRAEVNLRFDQINSRLGFAEGTWKIARRWGKAVDDHRIKTDPIIAELVRDVTDLKDRMGALEKKQQQ